MTPRRNSTASKLREATFGQWVGAVAVVLNFAFLMLDAHDRETVNGLDLALHASGFALAGFLVYPASFGRLVKSLKLRFPFISR